ncbi:hypothetical protein [Couchioplanes azureus]|uniref:hypothetical protein n=1 Tax=Couchioplanes caeruleus TaxID=56438 RepID=UPI00166FCEC9|nr:hypothetical protein [Couchioplanes caeruleus]GGQ77452.1 hypothetical protein GCM10010166_54250 [Couchioplanes caeruleus subsp. azureus]
MTRRAGIALVTALLLAASGCSSTDDQPGGKEAPLQTKTKADVEALARQQFETIAQLAGGELTNWEARTTACQGQNGEIADDGRWNLTAFAAVKLPADKHVAALRAVHDKWQAQGWEIADYRTLSDGARGTLSGRDPASGNSISLASSKPPVQIAMNLGSACYQPAPGEDPANS